MSEDKKYPGGYYQNNKQKDETDDCDNCIYDSKNSIKNPEECPSCLYIPNKEKEEK